VRKWQFRLRKPGPSGANGPRLLAGMTDPYVVLGLSSSATAAEVKAAYKRQAMRWHPDMHTNASDAQLKAAAKKFQQLSDAHEWIMSGGAGRQLSGRCVPVKKARHQRQVALRCWRLYREEHWRAPHKFRHLNTRGMTVAATALQTAGFQVMMSRLGFGSGAAVISQSHPGWFQAS
jgi:hypothetical protein